MVVYFNLISVPNSIVSRLFLSDLHYHKGLIDLMFNCTCLITSESEIIPGFQDFTTLGERRLIRTSRECRWELLMSLAVIIKVIIVDVCLLVLLTFSPIRFPDWRCPTAIPIDFIESRGSHD